MILFHAYLELLGSRLSTHNEMTPELALAHHRWRLNVSEHLLSVAIRAMRSGLYHAAGVLLSRFLAGGAPADEHLFIEGRTHHAHVSDRLRTMGGRHSTNRHVGRVSECG